MLTGFRGDVHNRIAVTKISPLLNFAREIKARSRFGV
jgi:hypothetical protein